MLTKRPFWSRTGWNGYRPRRSRLASCDNSKWLTAMSSEHFPVFSSQVHSPTHNSWPAHSEHVLAIRSPQDTNSRSSGSFPRILVLLLLPTSEFGPSHGPGSSANLSTRKMVARRTNESCARWYEPSMVHMLLILHNTIRKALHSMFYNLSRGQGERGSPVQSTQQPNSHRFVLLLFCENASGRRRFVLTPGSNLATSAKKQGTKPIERLSLVPVFHLEIIVATVGIYKY